MVLEGNQLNVSESDTLCAVVRQRVAAIDDRIAHGFVRIGEADLSANAGLDTLLRALLHPLKAFEILLNRKVAVT